MTNAGRFKQRVIVEQLISEPTPPARLDVTDDANWETYITRYAEVVETTGREYHNNDTTRAHITHRITMIFDSETRKITPKMRIRWEDTYAGETLTRKLNIEHRLFSKDARMVVQLQCQEVL
ncbi:MAG: head-tail adaptor protein [Planctomycetaceae bacterium]|nr:head-tail adaptor protein [Planctomycetaceae bacterium]